MGLVRFVKKVSIIAHVLADLSIFIDFYNILSNADVVYDIILDVEQEYLLIHKH